MKKLLILSFIALLALPGAVFAQRTATQPVTPASVQLTIAVNPGNAAIFVDGAQIKGNVATVLPGNHTIMTKAPGYMDFTTTVNVKGAMTLPVTMQMASFQLTIAVNPGNAAIFIDGAQIKGNRAAVKPGNHVIATKAPGYLDFTTAVSVNGNMTLPVTMQMANFQLTIAMNPSNAAIFIDGQQIKGNVASVTPGNHMVMTKAPGYLDFTTQVSVTSKMVLPVNMQLATAQLTLAVNPGNAAIFIDGAQIKGTMATVTLGNHTINTKASGYFDFTTSVSVNGNMTLPIAMQPALGTMNVVLPAANINTDMNGGHWSQIIIWVDGVQQKGQSVQLQPGKRLIKITSGGLQVEAFYDIQAGMNYTFEPFMGLNLKK